MNSILGLPRKELVYKGNSACMGCSAVLAMRHVLKALGEQTVMIIPAGCSTIIQGLYPKTAIGVPLLNIAFEAAAAAASGITAGFRAQGKKDITVVAWAGDGGTFDIGLQALSGAAERQTNMIYICYDNEAYMNTGIQRSGATPYGAITTTTPGGKRLPKKDLDAIVLAHDVPYLATANIGYPQDLYRKVKKAKEKEGFRFIHILSPCPPGWRFDSSLTVTLAKLAVQTGIWVLFEVEDGKFRLSGPSKRLLDPNKRKPVEDYLKLQGRFSELTGEDVKEINREIVENWQEINRKVSRAEGV
ncbi:MAG: pyruvate synthase subunit PorB [Promethearchaeota archaeon]